MAARSVRQPRTAKHFSAAGGAAYWRYRWSLEDERWGAKIWGFGAGMRPRNLLDMRMRWKAVSEAEHEFEGRDLRPAS